MAYEFMQGVARQGRARHGLARRGPARHGSAGQGTARLGKARQGFSTIRGDNDYGRERNSEAPYYW